MRNRIALIACLTVICSSRAAEIKSGPQPAKDAVTKVPGTFSPLVINGPWRDVNDKPVDRNHSLVVDFGLKPVVLVFARTYTDEPTQAFLKKLDARVAMHKEQFLKGGVVFLCFDDKRGKNEIEAKELLALAKEKEEILAQIKEKTQGLKNLVVAIAPADAPPAWNIGKKADITIVLYDKFQVKKTLGFEKGDLDEKTVAAVLTAIDSFVANAVKKPIKTGAARKEST